MPWEKEPLHRRLWSSTADFFVRWWKEATGPLRRSGHRNFTAAILRRVMLWVPVVVLVLVLLGGAGFYWFTGWRAQDLTSKALQNARAGNIQMAWVQIMSAKSLRGGSPEVRRTMIYVRSKANDPAALALWDELAAEFDLTAEEMNERARAAVRAGTDEQFAAAVAALERSGEPAKAAMFRARRALRCGNIEQAVAEARSAVQKSGDPADKMQLLMILMRRYASMFGSAAAANVPSPGPVKEIIALVDELQGTNQGNNAIAVALGAFPLPADKARAWAEVAMKDTSADNPALLPAARQLVRSGASSAQDIHGRLSPVYAGSDPALQAGFAEFLTQNGMAEEALLLISARKAEADPAAFEERGRALAALKRWNELQALSNSTASAPESAKLFFRGWAFAKLGDDGRADKALGDALRAAAREGRAPAMLAALDSISRGKVADTVTIELCGKKETADAMFRVARDRFGRRGQFASLGAAYVAAAEADPGSACVEDYRLRVNLLENRYVLSSQTGAAVAAMPRDVPTRFTHALALLREGRAGDALGVFHDIDVFAEQLPPGDQAIAIKIWEANGMTRHAASLRATLDPALLEKGEYALLLPSSSADNPNP